MKVPLCCLFVALLICSVVPAFAGKPVSSDIPVLTVLNDSDPITLAQYHIRSDGSGTYSSNSVVSSSLIANGYNGLTGDWVLDTRNSAGTSLLRRANFDFTDSAEGQSPFGSALAPTRMIAKCTLEFVSMPAMTLNQQAFCPLTGQFIVGTATYHFQMWPEQYPGTDYAAVTCVAVANNQCVQWTLTPKVAGGKNIAHFERSAYKNVKGVDLGHYYLDFSFKVAMPGYLTTP
jgi:hypothetical protein